MLLYLKVKPGQRLDQVSRVGQEWQIRIKAPAIDGKANEHLIAFLSEILGIPRSRISLLKGHTGRLKCVEIDAEEKHVLDELERRSQR
jgi:uncharacterized protein